MRYLILAAALIAAPALAWAADPPQADPNTERMTCVAVQLNAGGLVPESTPDSVMAELDMRGRWVVSSWKNVAWSAVKSSDPLSKCVARELLARRAQVAQNTEADTRCLSDDFMLPAPPFGNTMQSIIDADPIMRACQPRSHCDPGETCS